MHEEEPTKEKDFISLISQFGCFSETRDKMIYEIDDIIDRIKQNRRDNAQLKEAPLVKENPPVVITQLRDLIRGVDLSNEKLGLIIRRLNDLV